METFYEWLPRANLLARLRLLETYYTFDSAQYDRLFDEELQKVLARTTDPTHRQALERMRGFRWMSYVAVAIKRAGFHDEREIHERSHDIAVKLLTSTLFRGFDETRSGPFDLRFRASLRNALLNMIERERNRRRLLPTVPIGRDSEPGRWAATEDEDQKIIKDFRDLVRRRLGDLALAVLDVRLAGGETKSVIGRPEFGSPDKNVIKRVVCQIKRLAREYAQRLGDSGFLRDIERATGREAATVGKRRAAMAASRQRVGP